MTIAINSTPFLQSAGNDFFYDYLVKFAASNPEHQFVFIGAASIGKLSITSNNTLHVISKPAANHPLMWKAWLNYTLPAIARKHKADLIINTGGVCSLRSRIPQCTFTSDLSFLNTTHFFSKKQAGFLIKNTAAFLDKATTIVTASDFLTKKIVGKYSIDKEKIKRVTLTAGDLYQPIGWEEKEAIKDKYADGKEYFLFSGEIHPYNNLVNLLKAFSFFKKRQKSNMQLIIAANAISPKNTFIENLKTYKYRKEVKVLTGLPEEYLAKLTAAAYAFVYPSGYEGMALFPLQAMQCEVPVITSNIGALPEICGDAALYADPENFEDIADKMMLIFKDESKRSELIKKGAINLRKYNVGEKLAVKWIIY